VRVLRVGLAPSWLMEECLMSFEFTLYDALVSIDVPAEKARAVIDALEHDMGSILATKQDLDHLKELFYSRHRAPE
jgi:hypothetical protein